MTGDFRALSIITLWPTQTFHTEETKQVPLLQTAGRRPGVRASLPCRICEGAMLGFSGPWGMEVRMGEGQPLPFLITRDHVLQDCTTTSSKWDMGPSCMTYKIRARSSSLLTLQQFAFSLTTHIPDQTLFSLFPKLKNQCIYMYVCSLLLFRGFPGPRVGLQTEKVFQILWFSELNVLRWFAWLVGFFVLFFKLSWRSRFQKANLLPGDATKTLCAGQLVWNLQLWEAGKSKRGRRGRKATSHLPVPFLVVSVHERLSAALVCAQEPSPTVKMALHAGHSLACLLPAKSS